ncbi:MAG: MATE family efflux transporter, partial [Oscillospiraceae bacterium]|nr:MATE family efflux transporter [Oscillospiraceae bacterium]
MLSAVLALAWPTMLEQLMQTAVQYIDTAMVGALGTAATAAVGSTTTVNWLVGSTISAFGVGFLAFISQSLGAGRREDARRAAAQSVLAVLLTGAVFTVLTLSLSRQVPVWMQVDPRIRDLAARYFFILYLPMLPRAALTI